MPRGVQLVRYNKPSFIICDITVWFVYVSSKVVDGSINRSICLLSVKKTSFSILEKPSLNYEKFQSYNTSLRTLTFSRSNGIPHCHQNINDQIHDGISASKQMREILLFVKFFKLYFLLFLCQVNTALFGGFRPFFLVFNSQDWKFELIIDMAIYSYLSR